MRESRSTSSLVAAQPCPSCPIGGDGFCRNLPALELAFLHTAPRMVPAGQDLFVQGEACGEVFSILEGWAFLYELLEDGRRQILHFALPGDLLGFQPDTRALPFGAQAINDVALCVIPRARLIEVARQHSEVAFRLACIFSHDEALAYDRLTSLGRKTAEERMATLLLELFYRLRRRAPQAKGDVIRLPLTQTHIADALGLTPVHTNRTLGLLRQKGVIDYGNGVFRILSPRRLFAIAGIDPAAGEWAGEVPADPLSPVH